MAQLEMDGRGRDPTADHPDDRECRTDQALSSQRGGLTANRGQEATSFSSASALRMTGGSASDPSRSSVSSAVR